MATDQIPDMPRRRGGQPGGNMAAAWTAAWEYLAGSTDGATRSDLIWVMRDAGPVSFRTAREILIAAVDNGSLIVTSRDSNGRPTLARPS
jgi:hypothetical protein